MPNFTVLQNEVSIEGNGFDVTEIFLSFSRTSSLFTGELTSGIHGGMATVAMPLEIEGFQTSFFAAWMGSSGLRKDVTLKMTHANADSPFLEVTMEQAAITRYSVVSRSLDNRFLEAHFDLVSQKTTVGTVPLELTT